jgi:hypothetical protein
MNKETFDHVLKKVTDANFQVEVSEYREKVFGSWHITLMTVPKRRLVWDGKERWCAVVEETTEKFNGMNGWKDIWIDRHPRNDTIQTGIKFLCGEMA